MKKLSVILSMLGFASTVLAALPATSDPSFVDVPLLPGGFFANGTLYYLQAFPSHGDLDYASVNFGTTSSFFSTLKEIEPDYDWGWSLSVGYTFPYTGNDIAFNYFQTDTQETDTINLFTAAAGTLTPVAALIFDSDIFNAPFTFASATSEYDINQADLIAGQFIDIGCRFRAHPFVGARWTEFNRNINSVYLGPADATPATIIELEQSNFSGAGPLAGLDLSYYICMGFGAAAHFDSGLLIGDTDAENKIFSITGSDTSTSILNAYKTDTSNRIIPEMDAKLGLNYTYVFNNTPNSDLTVEIGWHLSKYYKIADRLYTVINDTTGTVNDNFIINRVSSNVGFSGPYISFVYKAF